jgi:stress response protein YsnF
MSDLVTALYDTRDEAEQDLQSLKAEVSLDHGEIYNPTAASVLALERLYLTADERTACKEKLVAGDYLLLARPANGEGVERIVAVLERLASEPVHETRSREIPEAPGTMPSSSSVASEERLPVMEEHLHVGARTVVRGGAKVRTRVEELPVMHEIELTSEFVRVASRPTSRSVSEQELEQGGLFRDRVFEIAQMQEEALVSKEVVVREEVVVTKTTEHRIEQIHDTVRRTVVETEYLGSEAAGGREQP